MKQRTFLKKGLPIAALAIAGVAAAYTYPSESTSVVPAAADTQVPTLYALVTAAKSWPVTEPSRGVYSIDKDLQLSQTVLNNDMSGDAALYADGKYYISQASMVGTYMVTGNRITVYDAATGEQIERRTMPANFMNVGLAYAYDRINDEVFALTYGGNSNITLLNSFDRENMSYTPIAQVNMRYDAIATDNNSELYGIKNGTLYHISKTDGTAERVMAWDETPLAGYPQSMIYSGDYGCMLWAYTNADQMTNLIGFNLEEDNQRSYRIGELGEYSIKELHSTAPLADPKAPSVPESLAFDFFQDGSLEGKMSFTVPSVTVDGSALTGEIKAAWYIDGVKNGESSVTPGASADTDITFESEGTHKISVELVNSFGKSERTSLVVFAGFDTPAAVTNLNYTLKGNDIEITWDAPLSLNGGAMEPLTYKVSHNGQEVATVSSTSYKETITGEQAVHSFSVTAVAGAKESETASISGIVAGDPFGVPYNCNFETEDIFTLFTVLNANEDKSTWKWMSYYKYAQYNKTYGDGDGDDYFITPAISFEAGNVYALRFTTQNNGPKPEALKVYITDGATLEAARNGEEIFSDSELTNRQNMVHEVLFTAKETKPANIAFYYCTEAANSQNVNLVDVSIERIGKTTAPKAVTGLTAVPAVGGNLESEISLVAPSHRFNDEELKEISYIELYRNGELIHTFNAPAPGSTLTFTDSEVPHAGQYSYSAGVFNESGRGQVVATDIYVGAFNLPLTYNDFSSYFTLSNGGDTDGWYIEEGTGDLINSTTTTGSHKDIAFSPAFYLKKDEIVNASFSYDAFNHADNAGTQIFFVALCDVISGKISTIYPAIPVTKADEALTADRRMSVNEDGVYCYCFIFDSNTYSADNAGIRIKDISITTDLKPEAPGSVSNYIIKAADNGELKGTFSFTLPKINLGNEPLEGTVSARIYNPMQEQIGEVTGKQPGEEVEIELPLLQGIHSYSVTTYNNQGVGATASYALFAGIDIPLRITNLFSYPTSDNMSADISWDMPDVGENHGWFDESQLRYKVYVNGEYVTTTKKREFYFSTKENKQRQYDFSVIPVTDAGEGSQSVTATTFLGDPLPVPFEENFEGGSIASAPWRFWNSTFEGCEWLPNPNFDGQPALVFTAFLLTEADAWMPKINLGSGKDAELSFDMYTYPQAEAYIEPFVSDDDVNFSSFGRFMAEELEAGWKRRTIDLSEYIGTPWIAIKLHGIVNGNHVLAIRNLKVGPAGYGVISDIGSDACAAYGENGCIRIVSNGGIANIYDISGRWISSASDEVIYVAPGIYVVALPDGNSMKVSVR